MVIRMMRIKTMMTISFGQAYFVCIEEIDVFPVSSLNSSCLPLPESFTIAEMLMTGNRKVSQIETYLFCKHFKHYNVMAVVMLELLFGLFNTNLHLILNSKFAQFLCREFIYTLKRVAPCPLLPFPVMNCNLCESSSDLFIREGSVWKLQVEYILFHV
jgi:hypothetical protein